MRTRVRVRGLDAACRMVALGAGVAVVPEAAAQRWDGEGKLALVPLQDVWADRRLVVVLRRLDALPSHARKLAEYLTVLEAPAIAASAADGSRKDVPMSANAVAR